LEKRVVEHYCYPVASGNRDGKKAETNDAVQGSDTTMYDRSKNDGQ
jgi:hypothetical protein